MLTIPEVARIKRAITRLVKAELEYQWRGAGHPEDVPAIEAECKAANKNMHSVLRELTTNPKGISK